MLTVEFLWGLVGGGVRFAQSFSCPTQLQCWGYVVLCCRWGCDNMNWKIQLHKFEICISKLAYLHLVIFNINLVWKHSTLLFTMGRGVDERLPLCYIVFKMCLVNLLLNWVNDTNQERIGDSVLHVYLRTKNKVYFRTQKLQKYYEYDIAYQPFTIF